MPWEGAAPSHSPSSPATTGSSSPQCTSQPLLVDTDSMVLVMGAALKSPCPVLPEDLDILAHKALAQLPVWTWPKHFLRGLLHVMATLPLLDAALTW